MKVLVLFDPHYNGDPADAVWIIESAENRKWFEAHAQSFDQNSAVFKADIDLITILSDVFEHHPMWTEIDVQGQSLTKEVADDIASDAVATIAEEGFRLSRP